MDIKSMLGNEKLATDEHRLIQNTMSEILRLSLSEITKFARDTNTSDDVFLSGLMSSLAHFIAYIIVIMEKKLEHPMEQRFLDCIRANIMSAQGCDTDAIEKYMNKANGNTVC